MFCLLFAGLGGARLGADVALVLLHDAGGLLDAVTVGSGEGQGARDGLRIIPNVGRLLEPVPERGALAAEAHQGIIWYLHQPPAGRGCGQVGHPPKI